MGSKNRIAAFFIAAAVILTLIPVTELTVLANDGDGYSPTAVEFFDGHTYALYDISLTYDKAETYCENMGGYLLTVNSQAEQDFINEFIKNSSKSVYWLGKGSSPEFIMPVTGSGGDSDICFICEWDYYVELDVIAKVQENPEIDIPEDLYFSDEIDEIIKNSVIFKSGSPVALVNGSPENIEDKTPTVIPFVDGNDRTLVPVRFIAESFGWNVEYNAKNKQITLSKPSYDSVIMYIGDKKLYVGEKEIIIDSAPVINQDRTFIPLRAFIEQSLGMKVAYVVSEKIIIISGYDIENTLMADKIAERLKGAFFVYPVSYPEKNLAFTYFINGNSGPKYNLYFNPLHLAVDFNIAAVNGARDIFAIYPGIIEETIESNYAYGNRVIIKHILPNGTEFYSLYAHLEKIKVSIGEYVSASQIIGEMGHSGTNSVHLHIAVWTGTASKSPEQEVKNPTSSEEITSKGKAEGVYGRIFYDVLKIVETQGLF